ncbi:uncharacterized protein MONOS_11175 [Monocercomonoides exilis]|uniref:uncharacterized protein n=1 Tax=Monocercomonoides exilis TaxID=2049356 RepID=UPI00355A7EB2|nr:hypothetical protein MONOS_11175 [Monocercomonoides exilis]|eukprot:MONOS_11175.1-p1 / transcript=MONOS_11175.1 / gene=MONOS_11175 / organism=Monocercomonoides_exilis_PA203 / gene_product=unspecified product / transcript_product=unspecified product / location=Mono_scaffold00546:24923-27064(-) / protein_length=714 / sequence_SO=supercontig / SO=protein_coding / is_pseudo=false
MILVFLFQFVIYAAQNGLSFGQNANSVIEFVNRNKENQEYSFLSANSSINLSNININFKETIYPLILRSNSFATICNCTVTVPNVEYPLVINYNSNTLLIRLKVDFMLTRAPIFQRAIQDGNEGDLSMDECDFSNLRNDSPEPLISSSLADTISLTKCTFSNVSAGCLKTKILKLSKFQQMNVNQCNFSSCESPIEGNIIQGTKGGIIRVENSTFVRCLKTKISEQQIFDGDATFRSTDFDSCTDKNMGGGGAICMMNGGDLSVFSCKFVQCVTMSSSGVGGAIAMNCNESYADYLMSISSCKFSLCSSAHGNGGAIFASQELRILASTFDNCLAQHCGGAVTTEYLYHGLLVNGSTFKECDSITGIGGAMAIFDLASTLFFGSDTFRKNTAERGAGGAISFMYRLYDGETPLPSKIQFEVCSFRSNKAKSISKRQDIPKEAFSYAQQSRSSFYSLLEALRGSLLSSSSSNDFVFESTEVNDKYLLSSIYAGGNDVFGSVTVTGLLTKKSFHYCTSSSEEPTVTVDDTGDQSGWMSLPFEMTPGFIVLMVVLGVVIITVATVLIILCAWCGCCCCGGGTCCACCCCCGCNCDPLGKVSKRINRRNNIIFGNLQQQVNEQPMYTQYPTSLPVADEAQPQHMQQMSYPAQGPTVIPMQPVQYSPQVGSAENNIDKTAEQAMPSPPKESVAPSAPSAQLNQPNPIDQLPAEEISLS